MIKWIGCKSIYDSKFGDNVFIVKHKSAGNLNCYITGKPHDPKDTLAMIEFHREEKI